MDLICKSNSYKLIDFPKNLLVSEKTVHSFYFKEDEFKSLCSVT